MEIKVNASSPYSVLIDRISRLNEFVCSKKVLLFMDSNIDKLYGDKLQNLIQAESVKFVFQAGEKSKNLETIENALSVMLKNNFTRDDSVLAVGGGVTGDMAGFCASIYMRGIKWINCPTSLLGMIDSSIGGKTGVDFKNGKNIVGSFYQPKLVLIDSSFLKTLKKEEFKNGLGECIKYAILNGEMEELNSLSKDNIVSFIAKCVNIKKDIVERDEREGNVRVLLNLGHTLGHAYEIVNNFKIGHGECVVAGIRGAIMLSRKLGKITKKDSDEILSLLNRYDFTKEIDFSEELFSVMLHDKKRHGESVNFVLPIKMGKCEIVAIEYEKLKELLFA